MASQTHRKPYWALILLIALLLNCFSFGRSKSLAQRNAPQDSLQTIFNKAAADFDTPVDLLIAIAWTRSHLRNQVSRAGEYGIMQLPGQESGQDIVGQAAQLIQETEETLKTDNRQNIRGAAALLHKIAVEKYPKQAELSAGQWYQVLKSEWRMANDEWRTANEQSGNIYARNVFALLSQGANLRLPESNETLRIKAWPEAEALLSAQVYAAAASEDYPGARWIPAHPSNYTRADRSTEQIDMIVIHTMQGYYASAINMFIKPDREASAHYLIRSNNGDITQMVRDEDIAWHAGHWASNTRSIGVELEGFTQDGSWYTEALYQSAAELVNYLAAKYHIPRDRAHIIGHNEVPGCPHSGGGGKNCHTDPGPYWDWDYFMFLLNTLPAPSIPTPTPAPTTPAPTPAPMTPAPTPEPTTPTPTPAPITPAPTPGPQPTAAPGQTTIRFSPLLNAPLYVGDSPTTTTVQIKFAQSEAGGSIAGAGLYGLAFKIQFAPSILEVVDADPETPGTQIAPGELFTGPNVFVARNRVEEGLIEFSASLLNPALPINTEGAISVISWRGLSAGASPLTFSDIKLADVKGRPLTYRQEDSLINVAPKALPPLSGLVFLQGRQEHSGVKVVLSEKECSALTVSATLKAGSPAEPDPAAWLSAEEPANSPFALSRDDGFFEITPRPGQSYHCLQAFYKGFLVGQQEEPAGDYLGSLTLPGGDVIANNRIDIFDIALIASHYGESQTAPSEQNGAHTDLNGNGLVDIYDLVIAAANYNQQGPVNNWKNESEG